MHEFEIAKKTGVLSAYTAILTLASVAALAITASLSSSAADPGQRAAGFALIIAAYLAVCASIYVWRSRRQVNEANSVFEHSTDKVLSELDETSLIAGSLKISDLFRLVASRINPLVGCSGSVLVLMDKNRTALEMAASAGVFPGSDTAMAEKCMEERSVSTESFGRSQMVVGVPLTRGTESFGAMQLFFDREPGRPLAQMDDLFEAIGTRVSTLVLSSMIFERNQERAMTDTTTNLPNERAFHLVLEQQIAASERDPENRPLSILAIDVQDFDAISGSRGHATGDAVLNFVARTARENLRQMDFFARTRNDEFLAVLPTASEDTANEIISRIEKAFMGSKAHIGGLEPLDIRLNFGWAVFGADGDSARSLLSRARMRRNMSSPDGRERTVLMFRP